MLIKRISSNYVNLKTKLAVSAQFRSNCTGIATILCQLINLIIAQENNATNNDHQLEHKHQTNSKDKAIAALSILGLFTALVVAAIYACRQDEKNREKAEEKQVAYGILFNKELQFDSYELTPHPIKKDGNCGPRALLYHMHKLKMKAVYDTGSHHIKSNDYALDNFNLLRLGLAKELKSFIESNIDNREFHNQLHTILQSYDSNCIYDIVNKSDAILVDWLRNRMEANESYITQEELHILAAAQGLNSRIINCCFNADGSSKETPQESQNPFRNFLANAPTIFILFHNTPPSDEINHYSVLEEKKKGCFV